MKKPFSFPFSNISLQQWSPLYSTINWPPPGLFSLADRHDLVSILFGKKKKLSKTSPPHNLAFPPQQNLCKGCLQSITDHTYSPPTHYLTYLNAILLVMIHHITWSCEDIKYFLAENSTTFSVLHISDLSAIDPLYWKHFLSWPLWLHAVGFPSTSLDLLLVILSASSLMCLLAWLMRFRVLSLPSHALHAYDIFQSILFFSMSLSFQSVQYHPISIQTCCDFSPLAWHPSIL